MTILKTIENLAFDLTRQEIRCNHVAAIFRGNSILCIKQNSYKTHPQIKFFGYKDYQKLHAELAVCIRFGREDCRKFSLAVLRIDRNGKLNQSKPCSGCQHLIKQLNFKRVFYTNDKGEWEKL